MIGFCVIIISVRPAGHSCRAEAELGIHIGIKQPEGDIYALYAVDPVFGCKKVGKQLFALHKVFERGLGAFLIDLERDQIIGTKLTVELLSDYHIIAAERAYGRGGVAVAYDLAAA